MGFITNILVTLLTIQCIVNGAETDEDKQNVTCSSGHNQMANPADPYSFYKCDDGKAVLFQCPQENWYSSNFESCVPKTDVNSSRKGSGGSNSPDNNAWAQNQAPSFSNGGFWWTQSSPRPEDIKPVPAASNGPDTATLVTNGKCNQNGPQYIKNPVDCSTFFLCLHGQAVLTKCPTDLYYDSETARCEHTKPNDCTLPA